MSKIFDSQVICLRVGGLAVPHYKGGRRGRTEAESARGPDRQKGVGDSRRSARDRVTGELDS